jgi:hypothetical protein
MKVALIIDVLLEFDKSLYVSFKSSKVVVKEDILKE